MKKASSAWVRPFAESAAAGGRNNYVLSGTPFGQSDTPAHNIPKMEASPGPKDGAKWSLDGARCTMDGIEPAMDGERLSMDDVEQLMDGMEWTMDGKEWAMDGMEWTMARAESWQKSLLAYNMKSSVGRCSITFS